MRLGTARQMKKTHVSWLTAALLLFTATANADLIVHEYVPGQKVTLDTATGYYWYWNQDDFVNMTYSEQMTAISGLGTYGNIAGGWHMATWEEMLTLWEYPEEIISSGFAGPRPFYTPDYVVGWAGRYDEPADYLSPYGAHAGAHFGWDTIREVWCFKSDLSDRIGDASSDLHSGYGVSAWVVSNPVPLPGAALFGVLGLGFAGWRLRRRTR